MQVERAKKEDFQELMDLMHTSFLTAKPRHSRFEELYPDLYQPSRDSMDCHRVIREDGRIVASMAIFPMTLRVQSVKLEVAGLAGVCTEPAFRKKGLMSHLSDITTTLLQRDGCPLSWLTGERDRYARFGWEKAGRTEQAVLRIDQHADPDPDWTVRQAQPENADISAMLDARKARAVSGECNPVTFRHKLKRMRNEVWEAHHSDKNEERFAYLVLLPRVGWIAEWGGDPEGIQQLVRHCLEIDSTWQLHLPPLSDPCTDLLKQYVETGRYYLDNLAVFSLTRLIRAYEPWLAERWPPGQPLLLESSGRLVAIQDGRVVTVEPIEAVRLKLDRLKLVRFLFGPESPSAQLAALGLDAAWLDDVFPLPFYMPWLFRV